MSEIRTDNHLHQNLLPAALTTYATEDGSHTGAFIVIILCLNFQRVILWQAGLQRVTSEFAAGLYLNLQRVYIWICSGSISEFAAGLCMISRRAVLQKWICSGWYYKIEFAAGHFAKADLQQVYVWICNGSFCMKFICSGPHNNSEFTAGHITKVNFHPVILRSEFAAGLLLNLQRVYVWFRRGPFCKNEFAAGYITKLNLQQVILQKPICSRSMSEFAAGHFAKADLQQVYVWVCSRSFCKNFICSRPYSNSEFTAGHITNVNFHAVILRQWICSRYKSQFAAGHFAKVICSGYASQFAAGDITKLNLQRVIWQKHICSRSMCWFCSRSYCNI